MKKILFLLLVFAFSKTSFGQSKNKKEDLNKTLKTQVAPHRNLSPQNLPIVYTFIGNGNWDDGSNWDGNGQPPPSDEINPGSKIIINSTIPGSQCILDIPYTIPSTTVAITLSVYTGSVLVVPDLIVN